MVAMEDFKKVLEEISSKRREVAVHQKAIDELHTKCQPLYEELDMLHEKKRLAEAAFLMEVESSVK